MRLMSIKKSEEGNALVLVALALVALLGVSALAVDGGSLYITRQHMVNAVDSAALAAGQELPDRPSTARDVAFSYAEANGCPASEVTVSISPDHREVQVSATRTVPLFFARVLGLASSDVGAQATARIDPVSSLVGAAPLSIAEQPFVFGIDYQLKDSPTIISDTSHGAGWYGPISLGGSGSDVYRFNLINGYSGEVKVGDVINTETGNMSGPTSQGITQIINGCSHIPACTMEHFAPDCSRLLLVPIVEPIWSDGQIKQIRVLGFASFLVEDYVNSGNDNYILGGFVKRVVSGDTSPEAPDYGLYGVRLIN